MSSNGVLETLGFGEGAPTASRVLVTIPAAIRPSLKHESFYLELTTLLWHCSDIVFGFFSLGMVAPAAWRAVKPALLAISTSFVTVFQFSRRAGDLDRPFQHRRVSFEVPIPPL